VCGASSIHTTAFVQHHIPLSQLGPHGEGMARAVTTCVHCGFCLAACPTYHVLGEEMDSPRGRIVLMKQALEGELRIDQTLPFIDRCLGCLACETACPSGVRYRELVVPFRALTEQTARRPADRRLRRVLLSVLESPGRFRLALTMGRAARGLRPVLPAALRSMVDLLPVESPASAPLAAVTPATGTRRARVALLAGCVQRVLRPSINAAALRILSANGVEVVVPASQGCCGALARHVGLEKHADDLVARNVAAFPRDLDAIVTTAAGCGSAMKEDRYPTTVADVAEFLDQIGSNTSFAFAQPTTIAYHDACHLGHAQRVRAAPRRLLAAIGNARVVELDDNEMCCGSAGLYNIEQPQTAAALGRRKAEAIRRTGAQLVATGNIGCMTQITSHLGHGIAVRHTVEVLDSALTVRP
jgi:glycolate oxidase iron-sulfur subunit